MGAFQDYLTALRQNEEHFRKQHPEVERAFEVSLLGFDALAQQLSVGRDAKGKSHVSLAPFLFLFQRQAMLAYSALASNQAFQAWGLVRTGLEAALIMGKWVDDKRNADVWSERDVDPRAYARVYQGTSLQSEALPGSDRIQFALKRINDLYLHPNPKYYYRHLELSGRPDGQMEMKVNFFDEQDDTAIGVLGVLHLVVCVQAALAEMFAHLFGVKRVDVGLSSLEKSAGEWATLVMNSGSEPKAMLMEMGLWPDSTAEEKGGSRNGQLGSVERN